MARVLGTALALTLAACGGTAEAPGPEWGGTIEERDGVTWVMNPEEPWWDGDGPPITLRLDRSFGNDESGPVAGLLSAVMGAAVDGDGNVYTVDSWKHRLVSHAADGSFRWARETEGEGPGDLSSPYNVFWDGGDRIYIDNQNGGRVDWWGLDGEFLGSQPLTEFDISQAFLRGVLPSGPALVSEFVRGRDGAQVHVFERPDTGWTRVTSFFSSGGRDATEVEWGGWTTSVRPADGAVFTGHAMDYVLQRYDLAGNLLSVWTRPLPTFLPPIVYRGTGTNFGEYDAPVRLPSGHYLVHHQRVDGIESHEEFQLRWDEYLESRADDDFRVRIAQIDLLDPDGRYLGSIDFDPTERLLDVGPNGYLYTSTFEPEIELRRYEIMLAPELVRAAATS